MNAEWGWCMLKACEREHTCPSSQLVNGSALKITVDQHMRVHAFLLSYHSGSEEFRRHRHDVQSVNSVVDDEAVGLYGEWSSLNPLSNLQKNSHIALHVLSIYTCMLYVSVCLVLCVDVIYMCELMWYVCVCVCDVGLCA